MERKLENFQHKMGINCMTCALSDIARYNGYQWDEDFCLGISGALSFWYVNEKTFVQATGLGNNVFDEFAATTRALHGFYQTKSNTKAWKAAKSYIDHNIPVILEVELMSYLHIISKKQKLDNKHLKVDIMKDFRIGGHVTCMTGYDDRCAYLNENFLPKTVRISQKQLRKARNPFRINFVHPHNKMHFFIFPERIPDFDYLIKSSMIRVIQNMELPFCEKTFIYDGLNYSGSGIWGMKEMFKDIEYIVKSRDPLELNRLRILNMILNRWGASEFNRASYARFLNQIHRILGDSRCKVAAEAYIDCSLAWKAFLKELDDFCSNNMKQWDDFTKTKETILEKEVVAIDKLHLITGY